MQRLQWSCIIGCADTARRLKKAIALKLNLGHHSIDVKKAVILAACNRGNHMQKFDTVQVLADSLKLYLNNFLLFALLPIIFLIGPAILVGLILYLFAGGLLSAGNNPAALAGAMKSGGAITAILLAVPILLIALSALLGSVIYASVKLFAGQSVTIGEAISVGIKSVWRMFVSFLVLIPAYFALIIPIGLLVWITSKNPVVIFLSVPFVIFVVFWAASTFYAALPARLMEDVGPVGAYIRSMNLSAGYRGAIFGFLCLTILVSIMLFILGLIPILGTILSIVTTSLSGIYQSAVYSRLRNLKEGTGAAEIANVFA
jgi:hypothetical protein